MDAGDKVVSVGDSVSIGFSTNNCHVFDGQGQVFEKLTASNPLYIYRNSDSVDMEI